ncbi:APC family permease [Mycolicibacterium sp. CBMA 226]|uniref:APC family permease n=1 Tax=Mycolicibacterium sp. CBMA 226 TaxID=2606611 RepID=UPI0012DFCBE2|nr:APC family permease [Mycolicibacterium sp. CBMA 226]MUL79044.1 APC family permease [Mycolicibacterium sp. CBMA 226]QGW61367.1 Putrescine importer PuuP [Mycolicibacterium sp.]
MDTDADAIPRDTDPTATDPNAADSRTRLRGNMGVFALLFTAMAFNAPLMTVVGTLTVPIGFGNGAGAPLIVLFGSGLIALLAVGFIKMYPFVKNSGGFYVYITAGLGKAVGLGASFLAQASYFSAVLGSAILAGISINAAIVNSGGPSIPPGVFALALIAVVGFCGYRQLDLSAKVLSVLLIAETVVVLSYNFAIIFKGGAAGLDFHSSFNPSTIFGGSVGVVLLLAVSSMGGFESTVVYSQEVRDPHKTIPRATYIFIAITGILYCVTSWSMIQAVGSPHAKAVYAANPAGEVLDTVQIYMGRVGHDLVTVLLTTSILAAALSAHNVASRYAFNLSNDRILPPSLSRVHSKHGSPHRASLTISVAAASIMVILFLFGPDPNFLFVQFLSAYSYAFILLLAATCVAVGVFLTRRKPAGTNIWHRVIAPGLAFVGLLTTLVFVTFNLDVLFGDTGSTTVTIVVALIYGLVVTGALYALYLKRNKSSIYALIGRQ